MALILWVMSLSLLLHGCLCSIGQIEVGCRRWTPDGKEDVCCNECHPGNRIYTKCGKDPKELCTPCAPGKFILEFKDRCKPCTKCVGVQVHLKDCTAASDTVCGCKEGFTCGNSECSFCVETCGKGQEPTPDRSCRPCPDGFFNDKTHSKCKPWSTKCPRRDQRMEKGDAFTDIKCVNASVPSHTKKPDDTEQLWPVVLSVLTSAVLMAFIIIIIITVTMKILKRGKKPAKPVTKTPIIRTPTDDPRTLIAIECSFHEAQQEQGSSTESLNSKESSQQLIA
ncbi:tumor necrosis factor receptor superfamily member 9a [Acanthochromis polyacanthus]|uniref:Tumor necrosis factor receptor superfamily, member 9a n=1 Tax=Acanthochromis polyacanthus TaxID=80966 RepID=A0A3Q1EU95_9TELE|nr:tumor necrosis factor receptor superfamily member 9a [Acanthochromis polyacanthus]